MGHDFSVFKKIFKNMIKQNFLHQNTIVPNYWEHNTLETRFLGDLEINPNPTNDRPNPFCQLVSFFFSVPSTLNQIPDPRNRSRVQNTITKNPIKNVVLSDIPYHIPKYGKYIDENGNQKNQINWELNTMPSYRLPSLNNPYLTYDAGKKIPLYSNRRMPGVSQSYSIKNNIDLSKGFKDNLMPLADNSVYEYLTAGRSNQTPDWEKLHITNNLLTKYAIRNTREYKSGQIREYIYVSLGDFSKTIKDGEVFRTFKRLAKNNLIFVNVIFKPQYQGNPALFKTRLNKLLQDKPELSEFEASKILHKNELFITKSEINRINSDHRYRIGTQEEGTVSMNLTPEDIKLLEQLKRQNNITEIKDGGMKLDTQNQKEESIIPAPGNQKEESIKPKKRKRGRPKKSK